MRIPRLSLTTTVLSAVSILVITTWILLSIISVKTTQRDFIIQKKEEARRLVQGMQGVARRGDAAALRPFAEGLTMDPGFVSLVLVDAAGVKLVSFPADQSVDPRLSETLRERDVRQFVSAGASSVITYSPILVGENTFGAVRLVLSLQREDTRVADHQRTFLAYFVLDFMLLLILGGFLLSRLVVSPVRRLLTATQRIADGDLHYRVQVPGSVEIAELANSFNRMVEALREKREEVERHVRSLEQTNRDLTTAREETLRAEKMASVGLLAAGTAHEIGTPLAAILGYSEILTEELRGHPETSDYVRRLAEEARRIDRIVKGLLDFARPREPVTEQVDLPMLVRETAAALEGQGALKHVLLTIAGSERIPPVTADPYQLQQVFTNLFINARDAMPGGGELRVGFSAGSKDVAVSFADSGGGILPENLSKVFEPFFSTKSPGKGTGLGLAICARIVDSFGGRIIAESLPEGGTIFTVYLPSAVPGE